MSGKNYFNFAPQYAHLPAPIGFSPPQAGQGSPFGWAETEDWDVGTSEADHLELVSEERSFVFLSSAFIEENKVELERRLRTSR